MKTPRLTPGAGSEEREEREKEKRKERRKQGEYLARTGNSDGHCEPGLNSCFFRPKMSPALVGAVKGATKKLTIAAWASPRYIQANCDVRVALSQSA